MSLPNPSERSALTRAQFQEDLVRVMEAKAHWSWSLMTSGRVPRERLHVHFEQEYETYVRDFPVLIGRAYVQCPDAAVRRDLAENLYEEETGGIVAGKPHPELFLEIPRGLRMDLSRFDHIKLLPKAAAYRATLDRLTTAQGWDVATAVVTLFIEGTAYERGELDPEAPKRPVAPLSQHPLVVHYGLPLESLALTKAHRQVEGDHRAAAWRSVLSGTAEERRPLVLQGMREACEAWLAYKQELALALDLTETHDTE